VDRHRSIAVIATALVVAACAGFYEPPVAGPTQTTPPGTPGPTTSAGPGTPAPTSSTYPAAERTAWDNATAGITRDGKVPLQTALEAFSVVYGALPGVQMPQGDDAFTGSGTGAVRWLLGHWQELTEEQKTAASRIFDPNVAPATSKVAGSPFAHAGG
jgi:hypothetical protein